MPHTYPMPLTLLFIFTLSFYIMSHSKPFLFLLYKLLNYKIKWYMIYF